MPAQRIFAGVIGLLFFLMPLHAWAAERPGKAWETALNRYLVIAQEAEKAPMSEDRRNEAMDILSKFRIIAGSPGYDAPLPAQPNPVPGRTPELLARSVLVSLQDMEDIQRRLAAGPVAEEQSLRLKRRFMGDRRDVGLALDLMAGLLKQAPAQPAKKKPGGKRRLKILSRKPLKDEPLQDAFTGTQGGRFSCRKVFRMKGHFQAEFPCWLWHFWARERSAALEEPYSTGNTGPRGLWINDGSAMHLRRGIYKFKWKDAGGNYSRPYKLAAETISKPDVSGIAAHENASEVVIDPELKGTNFYVRGFRMTIMDNIPCSQPPDGSWNISISVVYWPTAETCASWLSHWAPPLPGRQNSALEPIDDPGTRSADGVFERPYEMTYDMSLQHCAYPKRYIPQRIRILCAKGPRGLYTFTLDATDEAFESALPILEKVRDSFHLLDKNPVNSRSK